MIRPFTAICVLLAGASGLYLYTEKHRTTLLDQQISRIVQDTQHTRERTAMLRAEWALLNQPDRLAALAGRFLPDLHPLAPSQFVQMASLTQHLPEIAQPAPPVAVAAAEPPASVASGIAPQPVMARAVVSTEPREEIARTGSEAKHRAAPRPVAVAAHAFAEAAPASLPAPGFAHHATARPHPAIRFAALKPAPFRSGGDPRAAQSRLAAYEGGPVRNLLQGGAVYSRPAPMQAMWHPSYAPRAAVGSSSSLGFAHASLPAPVPVQGGE